MNFKIFRALTAATLLLVPLVSSAAETSTNAPGTTASKDGPNRFYGPVTKVDTNKNAFTVGDQTFVITAETQIVNKDGEKAKLADAVVGEPARGTYTKKSDGTLNVTKVRFGRKANSKAGGSGKGGGKKKADSTQKAESAQ
jgi:hypothetical protein